MNPSQLIIRKGINPNIIAVPKPNEPSIAKNTVFGMMTVKITKNTVMTTAIRLNKSNLLDLSFCLLLNFTIPILGLNT